MSDQTAAALIFLTPFALLWAAFMTAETARLVAAIRTEGRNHDR